MRAKVKMYSLTAAVLLAFLFALIPQTWAAGTITLTPTAQAPGDSVSVSGTGFGATKAVGIGFGEEVAVTREVVNRTVTGAGPYVSVGSLAFKPVKPGTFNYTVNVTGIQTFDVYDCGNGTLKAIGSINATADYVAGQYTSTSAINSTVTVYANYTHYQYDVTPAAGVNTSPAGSFTASITVPAVANGNYTVTVIDTDGNVAVAILNVNNAIPEGLPFGAMLLLSSVAVAASSWYFRKRPKI